MTGTITLAYIWAKVSNTQSLLYSQVLEFPCNLWNTELQGESRLAAWVFAILYTAGGTDGSFVDMMGHKETKHNILKKKKLATEHTVENQSFPFVLQRLHWRPWIKPPTSIERKSHQLGKDQRLSFKAWFYCVCIWPPNHHKMEKLWPNCSGWLIDK